MARRVFWTVSRPRSSRRRSEPARAGPTQGRRRVLARRPTTPIARWCSRRPTAVWPGSTSVRRTSAVAPPTSPLPSAAATRRIYAAYATSGVWKTDDDGASWQAVFENQPSTSIGDVAVAPSNPDIVWVGTGESNLFRASMPGVGVFKSTDGGRTFQHSGLTDTQTIARIVVHPTNPDIVYVAAGGHGWTDNETRGVFKTDRRRRTWTKVLYSSPRTGAIDLVMDPSDPEHALRRDVAARPPQVERPASRARIQRERHLQDAPTAGRRGRMSSSGLPPAQFRGRIGIDVSRIEPERALCVRRQLRGGPSAARRTSGTPTDARSSRAGSRPRRSIRTDDKGRTWRKVSASDDFMTQPLRHLRLGVRSDPGRSGEREHDLHAWA